MKTITITTRVMDNWYDCLSEGTISFSLSEETAKMLASELANSKQSPFAVENKGGYTLVHDVEIGTEEEGRMYHAVNL